MTTFEVVLTIVLILVVAIGVICKRQAFKLGVRVGFAAGYQWAGGKSSGRSLEDEVGRRIVQQLRADRPPPRPQGTPPPPPRRSDR